MKYEMKMGRWRAEGADELSRKGNERAKEMAGIFLKGAV